MLIKMGAPLSMPFVVALSLQWLGGAEAATSTVGNAPVTQATLLFDIRWWLHCGLGRGGALAPG